MSRHVSYRGKTIDMESLSRNNEQVPAIGNMKVNAKGDQIDRGVITKTAEQIARDNHRVQSVVVNTGLKGKQPVAPDIQLETPKPTKAKVLPKEKELPSGDIVVE
jgi:hypothetical protein